MHVCQEVGLAVNACSSLFICRLIYAKGLYVRPETDIRLVRLERDTGMFLFLGNFGTLLARWLKALERPVLDILFMNVSV